MKMIVGRTRSRVRGAVVLVVVVLVAAACAPSPTTDAPVVSGSATVGSTLSVSTGGWSVPPESFSYRWESCAPAGSNCATVGSNSATYVVAGSDLGRFLRATVTGANGAGVSSAVSNSVGPVVAGSGLPPDPATVAPPVDPSTPTSPAEANEFLYTGPDPIQTGVAPGTIEPLRSSVVRGRVLDTAGAPLAGAAVTIEDHLEYGQTLSRADGQFDLAMNGGGYLTVHVAKAGRLPVERQVVVPPNRMVVLDDVALTTLDTRVTPVQLDGSVTDYQSAHGSRETDGAGSREASLLVPPGTVGSLVMADGTTQPLATAHFRATEFTVGDRGPAAMPGTLPAASAYTYAVDLSLDEVAAAGAAGVTFDRPLALYVDNFLHFPAGTTVPVGYYDAATSQWVASDSGVVVALVSVTGGLADLDVTGDGVADDAAALAAVGITDGERARLAAEHVPGDALWRASITHFTYYDLNWGVDAPGDAVVPKMKAAAPPPNDDCYGSGSVIGCERQTLGEDLPLAGTGLTLHYQSDRQLGGMGKLNVPLTGDSVPSSLRRVELTVSVAGRRFSYAFAPSPNLSTTFQWDGRDAYGRVLQGVQTAYFQIGYVYPAIYGRTGLFGTRAADPHVVPVDGDRARQELTISQFYDVPIEAWDNRGLGLGGWSIDQHHVYDRFGHFVARGDGTLEGADNGNDVISTVAGPALGSGGDGGPASAAQIRHPNYAEAGPDGSLYLADYENHLIRRVDPHGVISTFAGGGSQPADGVPATSAGLGFTNDVAIGPDGAVYVTDVSRVYKVTADGIIHTIAGDGTDGRTGDGGPAVAARVQADGIAVGPDGSVYLSDFNGNRIRRIAPDGRIWAFAGNGNFGGASSGFPALFTQVWGPSGLTVGADGSVYVAEYFSHVVQRIRPDGIIETVAGNGQTGSSGDGSPALQARLTNPTGVALTTDGRLLVADWASHRVRVVESDGTMWTFAGGGSANPGDSGPAGAATLSQPWDVAVSPDGSQAYIVDPGANRVRLVRSAFPGRTSTDIDVASDDGSEIYEFDPHGRHQRTLDSLTGSPLLRFGYDGAGRLATVTDPWGNVTTVEHDAGGAPTAIVAPGGQRTSLAVDAHGYLSAITDPDGASTTLTTGTTGLLATLTTPRGGIHRFDYDSFGRLTKDTSPSGVSTTLASADTPGGFTVTQTTAAGRVTRHEVQLLPEGGARRIVTEPSGAVTTEVRLSNGTSVTTYPDGRTASQTLAPDPRFGMQSPIAATMTVTSPGRPTTTWNAARSVSLSDPANLLSVTSAVATVTSADGATTTSWDASTHTATVTTPNGRHVATTFDATGLPTRQVVDGSAAATGAYDSRGRLTSITQDGHTSTLTWDDANHLTQRVDPAGGVTAFVYDAVGRVRRQTLPSGRAYQFTYESDGSLASIVTPTGATHTFSSDLDGRPTGETAPGGASTATTYGADGELNTVTQPSGRTETYGLDAAGRPTGVTSADVATALGYGDATDRFGLITRTPPGGVTQGLDEAWSGDALVGSTFTGPTSGSFAYAYDAVGRLASVSLDGAPGVSNSYDHDGNLTARGTFLYDRTGPTGQPATIGDGTMTTTLTYDAVGRVAGRSIVVAGTPVYSSTFTRDDAGLTTNAIESVAGVSHGAAYHHDADGHLTSVSVDGTATETYAYDANGNRTAATGPAGTNSASFDAADRLTSLGGVAVTSDGDGRRSGRGGASYHYGPRGELDSVTVGGKTATYGYDGFGRLTSRTVDGETTQFLYGQPDFPFELTAERDPAGVLTTYAYEEGGRLMAFDRGGVRYYVATDLAGTPRVVTDVSGAVVKRVDRDAYGRVTADTAPPFRLSVGFGGGVEDPITGFVRLGVRDYDPASGSWTAADPSGLVGAGGNRYAYGLDDPVDNVDRTGLLSVSLSSYATVGGGIKLTFVKNGFQVCGEGGVGAGSSMEIDPAGSFGRDGWDTALFGQAKVSAGVFSATAKVEIAPCPKTGLGLAAPTAALQFCAGPFCETPVKADHDGVHAGLKPPTFKPKPGDLVNSLDLVKASAKAWEVGAQGKAGSRFCFGTHW